LATPFRAGTLLVDMKLDEGTAHGTAMTTIAQPFSTRRADRTPWPPQAGPLPTADLRGSSSRTEIRCAGCGYGGVVSRLPRRCPMCGVRAWEITGLRPSSFPIELEG
jgi:hypothetical protein